ncbi:MAG TPA: class I SAM-dependent methyltransferase [Patescibacteria group bacterium]|nr:class I SAM-dependent methyltransferase [Patescibacteria group bacterium]
MKIIKGIKHQDNPFVIPGSSRNDLPGFFKEMGYQIGAEIGVYKGWFSRKFCKAGLKIYAIDYWTPYPGFDRVEDARVERQEYLYHRAWKLLSRYENATVVRKTSMEALKNFENESLDFVYIDGNHILKYVAEDIDGWSKKVRKGGTIAGHDYIHPEDFKKRKQPWAWENMQVKFAVDAYTQANRIKNWYVIGKDSDRCPSWFWIK